MGKDTARFLGELLLLYLKFNEIKMEWKVIGQPKSHHS